MNSRLKIIVCDANPIDAELLRLFLSRKYEVSVQDTDLSDLNAISVSEIDILFVNRTLSGAIDGIEATKRLREHGFLGAIIGTSSEFTPQLMLEWKIVGCDALLPKPISFETLTNAINELNLA